MFEAVACPLLGILLGTRFRVFVLLPAALLVALIITWIGFVEGRGAGALLASQVTGLIELQLGYLASILLKFRRELASNHRLSGPEDPTARHENVAGAR